MSPFEAFMKYAAVKRHFSPGSSYDYHKYGGKLSLSSASFEQRPDRYQFDKLAKIPDLENYLVANLSVNPKLWIGHLFDEEAHARYAAWMKTIGSLTYTLKKEMQQFAGTPFKEIFVFRGGKHPPALVALIDGSLSAEVLCAVDSIIDFTPHWQKRSWDPTVRGAVNLIHKLSGFISFHPETLKRELKNIFEPSEPERSVA